MRKQISLIQNAFSAYFSNSEFLLSNAIIELNNAVGNSNFDNDDPMQPSKFINNNNNLNFIAQSNSSL